MATFDVNVIVAEVTFGDRPHAVADRSNPNHLCLQTNNEIWHKETSLNLAVQHLTRLDPDWEYVAWVDADVHFCADSWAEETVHQLQHYDVLQPWSEALDTGPDGCVIKTMPSFGWAHVHEMQSPQKPKKDKSYGKQVSWHHPGLAWAYTREAWETLGGLYDYSIIGHADTIMALALVGCVHNCGLDGCSPEMLATLYEWQRRAAKLKQNIGYVAGPLMHRFHGSKKERQYGVRRKILSDTQYNPHVHTRRDAQGLLCLDEDSVVLRDRLRQFFRARNEDGTSL